MYFDGLLFKLFIFLSHFIQGGQFSPDIQHLFHCFFLPILHIVNPRFDNLSKNQYTLMAFSVYLFLNIYFAFSHSHELFQYRRELH